MAFAIGVFTPTPEIQLFSIGNAAAIVLDYIYQWTVFGSFMVLTGHWELREVDGIVSENGSVQKIVKAKEDVVASFMRKFNACMKKIANWLVKFEFILISL